MSAPTLPPHGEFLRGTAYMVLMDGGQIFGVWFDEADANDRAYNIQGVVAPIPVLRDFRLPEAGGFSDDTDRAAYDDGQLPRRWND